MTQSRTASPTDSARQLRRALRNVVAAFDDERLGFALLLLAVAAAAAFAPASSDTYWHLRAGQELWSTGRVPLTETFSHTASGRAWPNHEWLFQAMAYPLMQAGGFPLLTLLAMAVLAGTYALTYRLMRGSMALRFGLVVLTLPVVSSVWALRPQLFMLLFLAVLLTLLASERFRLVPILFLVWANIHASVSAGGLVLAAVTLMALVLDRPRFKRLLPVLVASGVATLLTPLGFDLVEYVWESLGSVGQTGIEEWQPLPILSLPGALFALFGLGLLVLLARGFRSLQSWDDRLLAVATLVMLPFALWHVRNASPCLIAALPLGSRLLVAVGWDRFSTLRKEPADPKANALLFFCLAAGISTVIGFSWSKPIPRLMWKPIEPEAIEALGRCEGPLYNRYADGGYLLWLAPERKVYIDSRYDPYPADFVRRHFDRETRGQRGPILAREGLRCAFLPTSSPSIASLSKGGWRTLYESNRWLVLGVK